MTEVQLSIRSAHAHKVARRLAKLEGRSVRQIVERALDAYAKSMVQETRKESAADFFTRIRKDYALDQGEDFDLDAIIREGRAPHKPVEF